MTALVWVALRDQGGGLAAGPFDTREAVEELFPPTDWDDVHAAEVTREWFTAQWTEINDRANAEYAALIAEQQEREWRRIRTRACCAMSSLAQALSDRLRPAAYRAAPGSPERVALADARGTMDDLRVAFAIAARRGDLDDINRNGYTGVAR